MAQGRVTDFFSARKGSSSHASKRRKIEITSEPSFVPSNITNVNPYRNLTSESEVIAENLPTNDKKENQVFSPLQTRAARKSKTVANVPTKKAATRSRKSKTDPKQKRIPDVLNPQAEVTEAVTSSWDEHDGAPTTPTKSSTTGTASRKRTRRGNKVEEIQNDVTPEKRKTETKPASKSTAKKKLQLQQKEAIHAAASDSDIGSMVIPKTPPPISPLPPTPESQQRPTKPAVKMSESVTSAIEKCKNLLDKKQVSVESTKAKLSNIDNLDDLKNRLASMKEAKAKLKTPVPTLKKFEKIEVKVETPSETKPVAPKAPAYERFHHLATPAPPTLSLPYKYRLLAEQFRGMDQVVSMLHNRNEVCTFSKLKAAVQQFTKRNFEKSHIGQIKTVLPAAYELRQERGLNNAQGFKQAGYQLTIEARLEDPDEVKGGGKPTFKASHLLSRRTAFHSQLVYIVKQHHKKFLASLSRPLSVPDDKITRWHPKFQLDEVPDVEETPLPQPPDVKIFQTARDVLENTKGKLDPKVKTALEATAKDSEDAEAKSAAAPSPVPKPAAPTPVPSSLKGVPQSLLEKIRAREAANAAASLMRNPKEEKRLTMMKRLPDIMRLIRSHFVTEKKPALTMDSVIQKIMDSYKSCIAQGDVEPHVNLCVELLPEWISVVQIKKGKYLKIDKNIDLQTLTDKVNNILKTKK